MFVKREGGIITAVYRWPNPQASEEIADDHADLASFKERRQAKREAAPQQLDRLTNLEARIATLEARLAPPENKRAGV